MIGQRHRHQAVTDCDVMEVSTPESGTTWRLEDDFSRPDETPEQRKKRNAGSIISPHIISSIFNAPFSRTTITLYNGFGLSTFKFVIALLFYLGRGSTGFAIAYCFVLFGVQNIGSNLACSFERIHQYLL